MENKREGRLILALLLLVAAATLLSLSVGRYPVNLLDLLGVGNTPDAMAWKVFYTLRLPRTVMALLAGAGLGMSGAVFQVVFRNPIASPDIIGVAAGANLGAAFAIVFVGTATLTVAAFSFVGAAVAVAVVMGLAGASGNGSSASFVLSGIVIGSLAQAVIMFLKLCADPARQLAALDFWAMGSLGGITSQKLLTVAPLILVGILGMELLSWQTIMLSTSDRESAALGVSVGLTRAIILLFATLTVAAIVCVTGLITFMGLLAPHVARLLLKRTDRQMLRLSAVTGALLLTLADCLARSLTTSELPISILTSLLGAPFLGWLLWKRRVTL